MDGKNGFQKAGNKLPQLYGGGLCPGGEVLLSERSETEHQRVLDAQRFAHEIAAHKVELETQKRELAAARNDLEALLGKYTELFDFAPVSYFILDSGRVVNSVNLTGSSLLGMERSRINGRYFEHFIPAAGRPAFAAFLAKVFKSQVRETCEAVLLKADDSQFLVQIEAVAAASGTECRLALVDITERKRALESLQKEKEASEALQKMGEMAEVLRNMGDAALVLKKGVYLQRAQQGCHDLRGRFGQAGAHH